MEIRKATPEDIKDIMPVFDAARSFMRKNGNMHQWTNGYPSEKQIMDDITSGRFYLISNNGETVGCFCFFIGREPNYDYIFDGEWPDDKPYGTIHRLASNGKRKGIADCCIEWCSRQCQRLRADTHADNKTMTECLIRNGFEYCGKIYVEDGSERNAYQKICRPESPSCQ